MLYERIGLPAMLEQMAEECNELAHACLKYSRYLRNENPVYTEPDEMIRNINEEMADVTITLGELLGSDFTEDNNRGYEEFIAAKIKRMMERMEAYDMAQRSDSVSSR